MTAGSKLCFHAPWRHGTYAQQSRRPSTEYLKAWLVAVCIHCECVLRALRKTRNDDRPQLRASSYPRCVPQWANAGPRNGPAAGNDERGNAYETKGETLMKRQRKYLF